MPAPIALFVYNRPRHAVRTIAALQANQYASESDLYIFSDAPKTSDPISAVREVREYIKTVTGFASVKIVERGQNYGLARSIISGTDEVVKKYGRAIVLEDDMVTSPHFLRYMNEALALYENDEDVISIHGYVYPVGGKLPETFFLRGADCWGWATWRRGWELFEPDGGKLLSELETRRLTDDFDFNGACSYTQMLRDQVTGKNDSWAVRWYASAFVRGKLSLYPGTSLVRNIGLDSSGTHCGETARYDSRLAQAPIRLERLETVENSLVRELFSVYFRELSSPVRRFVRKAAGWIKRAEQKN